MGGHCNQILALQYWCIRQINLSRQLYRFKRCEHGVKRNTDCRGESGLSHFGNRALGLNGCVYNLTVRSALLYDCERRSMRKRMSGIFDNRGLRLLARINWSGRFGSTKVVRRIIGQKAYKLLLYVWLNLLRLGCLIHIFRMSNSCIPSGYPVWLPAACFGRKWQVGTAKLGLGILKRGLVKVGKVRLPSWTIWADLLSCNYNPKCVTSICIQLHSFYSQLDF